jgi:hypothetical protein
LQQQHLRLAESQLLLKREEGGIIVRKRVLLAGSAEWRLERERRQRNPSRQGINT